ncbi:MAG TPA: adenosylmethionine decarboxylase [Fimbriimonadaceae bacterium]|nr:adenosylmethionine decarboxylase [Fimbriimonadaceae bacterium]
MSTIFILVSSAVFAAVAVRPRSGFLTGLSRWFRKKPVPQLAAPAIVRDEGWTLIRCDDEEQFGRWLDRDEQGLPPLNGEEPSLGSHLLIELYGCDQTSLEQERCVGTAMRDAAVESEATVVAQSFHEFKPYGVSGAVIIQESHYTIHTWPEHGYAAVDLFYCGGTVKVHKAIEVLRERFSPERIKFLVVRRGLQSEVHR